MLQFGNKNITGIYFCNNGALSTISEVNLINGETPLTIWTLNTDIHGTKFKLTDGNIYNFTDSQLNKKVQPQTTPQSGIVSPYNKKITDKLKITAVSCCEHIETIGDNAFYECTSLSSIDCLSVQTIGYAAFQGCQNLYSIDCLSVKTIKNYAFFNCSKLSSIDCRNVQTLGNNIFSNCSDLRKVNLSNATDIIMYQDSIFDGCSDVSIYLSDDLVVQKYTDDTGWSTLTGTTYKFKFIPVNRVYHTLTINTEHCSYTLSQNEAQYLHNSIVHVTVTPDTGYEFADGSDDPVTYDIIMSSDITKTYSCQIKTFTVTINTEHCTEEVTES